MIANDNAGNLIPRGVLRSIASKLAPTRWCTRILRFYRDCACSTNHPINSRNFGEGPGFSGNTR
ncbi:hypothetical protein PSJE_11830 [Pseudomonas jessenii]|nr:hypothetical protein PSJE_11830 [Pseudomonas jessenii]